MSKDIRDEKDRRIAELEALVAGLTNEVGYLNKKLDKCERANIKLTLAVAKAKGK